MFGLIWLIFNCVRQAQREEASRIRTEQQREDKEDACEIKKNLLRVKWVLEKLDERWGCDSQILEDPNN